MTGNPTFNNVVILPVRPERTPPYAAEMWVLFFKIDDAPGVAFATTTRDTIKESILGFFWRGFTDEKMKRDCEEECAGYAAQLSENGKIDFEDGWIVLCRDTTSALTFLMGHLVDARADERFEQEQHGKANETAADWKNRYENLRASLVGALGENTQAVVTACG